MRVILDELSFDLQKILAVSYFYSTYGFKYKHYKPSSLTLNKGTFLGHKLEWKSIFVIFLENLGIKKIYFSLKKFLF